MKVGFSFLISAPLGGAKKIVRSLSGTLTTGVLVVSSLFTYGFSDEARATPLVVNGTVTPEVFPFSNDFIEQCREEIRNQPGHLEDERGLDGIQGEQDSSQGSYSEHSEHSEHSPDPSTELVAGSPSEELSDLVVCPRSPTGVTAVAQDSAVSVSWSSTQPKDIQAQASVLGHVVYVSPGDITVPVLYPQNFVVVEGLKNGILYEFTVRAVGPGGASPPSEPVESTPRVFGEPEIDGLIVQYTPRTPIAEEPGIATGSSSIPEIDLEPGRSIGFGLRTVEFPDPLPQSTAEQIAAELEQLPEVLSAQPDYIVSISVPGSFELVLEQELFGPMIAVDEGQNQQQLDEQVGFASVSTQVNPTWGLDRVDQRDLPLSRSYSYDDDGDGVYVYVLDTGIRSTHEEFVGRIAPGFTQFRDGRGTEDCHGHGTHVAGTVGGTTYGVAKNATLVPVRVLGCDGSGSASRVIAGLQWVISEKTRHPSRPAVINMSLGGFANQDLDNAVVAAVDAGITVVAASGNSTQDACSISPARVPEAITVNASTINDVAANFSNFGPCTDIYAPGQSITSASILSDTRSRASSGTSMAAPHVAGAVARVLERNPGWSPSQVWSFIDVESTPIDFGRSNNPNKLLFVASEWSAPLPGPPQISAAIPGVETAAIEFSLGGTGGNGITNIEYSLDGGNEWIARNPAGTSSPLVITGLTNDTSYTISLRARNSEGISEKSSDVLVMPGDAPSPPIITGTTFGDRQLGIIFTPGSSSNPIINYEYSLNGGESWVELSPARTTSPLPITGLVNGTPYDVSIRAVNDVGRGAPSNEVTATPATIPSAPTINNVTSETVGFGAELSIFFQPGDDGGTPIIGYEIRFGSSSEWMVAPSIDSPLTVLTECCDQSVDLYIRAVNLAGTGPQSSLFRSRVEGTVPFPVEIASVTPDEGQLTVGLAPVPGGWQGPAGVLEYRLGPGDWQQFSSPNPPFVISGLVNGTPYSVQVRRTNQWGPGESSGSVTATPDLRPAQPRITEVVPGNEQLAIHFDQDVRGPAVLNFEVQTGGEWGPWIPREPESSASPWIITGLNNFTTWSIRVRAVNSIGVGEPSQLVQGTPMPPPSAPMNIWTRTDPGSVTIHFSPAARGSVINHEYSLDGGATWITPNPPVTSSPITLTGLADGTTYNIRLRTIDTIGIGSPSSVFTATTPSIPGPPTITEIVPGDGSLVIDIEPGDSGGSWITDYEYSLNGGPWQSGTNSRPIVIWSVTNGVAYSVAVRAVNAVGPGAPSNIVTAIPRSAFTPAPPPAPTVPGQVTGVAASDLRTGGTVRLSWAAPRDSGGAQITGYRVMVSGDNGINWFMGVDNTGSLARRVDISGLTNGVPYIFQVQAVSSAGWGALSSSSRPVTATGRPQAPVVAGVVAGNGLLVVTVNRLSVAEAGGLPVSYQVRATSTVDSRLSRTCTIARVAVYSGTASCTVGRLANGHEHLVTVVASNARGAGGVGTSVASSSQRTPMAVAPTVAPSGVRGVDARTGGAVRVSWRAPSGAGTGGAPITNYVVQVSPNNGVSWFPVRDVRPVPASAANQVVTGWVEGGVERSFVNGVAYRFRVAAVNSVGQGVFSGMSGAVTATGRPQAPVVAGVVAGNGLLVVTVNRLSVAEAGGLPVSYQVRATSTVDSRLSRTCTIARVAVYSGTASCTVGRLANGHEHLVTVVASNARGAGGVGTSVASSSQRTPTP